MATNPTMPMVKVIYRRPMLPDLARVMACLYEKNITFELQEMYKGVPMTEDMLKLQISSHRKRTPTLIDGPNELFESRNICKHIAKKNSEHGYQFLLGKDPLGSVSVEKWIQSEDLFDRPSSDLVFYLAFNLEADIDKSQSEKKLVQVLNMYEQRLGESAFLAENYFTLVDLYHLPNTYYLEKSEEYGYLFKDRKNVYKWWKTISGRESWQNVVQKFEELGLQFNVPVSHIDTNMSPLSPSQNGIRNGTTARSESGSKNESTPSKNTGGKVMQETVKSHDNNKSLAGAKSQSTATNGTTQANLNKAASEDENDPNKNKPSSGNKPSEGNDSGAKKQGSENIKMQQQNEHDNKGQKTVGSNTEGTNAGLTPNPQVNDGLSGQKTVGSNTEGTNAGLTPNPQVNDGLSGQKTVGSNTKGTNAGLTPNPQVNDDLLGQKTGGSNTEGTNAGLTPNPQVNEGL